MKFFAHILTLTEKDVRIEFRSKEALYSSGLFVILTLLILNFSVGVSAEVIHSIAPGILWVVIAFAGSIALSHVTSRERQDRTMEGIVLTGCSGTTIYFAKFLTAMLFMIAIELLAVPVFIIFFNYSFGDKLPLVIMILALGTIGYVAIGTLFATLLGNVRLKELLLPVIFYPVIIPHLIVATKATEKALMGVVGGEVSFLIGADIIFLTASALLFDFVLKDFS